MKNTVEILNCLDAKAFDETLSLRGNDNGVVIVFTIVTAKALIASAMVIRL